MRRLSPGRVKFRKVRLTAQVISSHCGESCNEITGALSHTFMINLNGGKILRPEDTGSADNDNKQEMNDSEFSFSSLIAHFLRVLSWFRGHKTMANGGHKSGRYSDS